MIDICCGICDSTMDESVPQQQMDQYQQLFEVRSCSRDFAFL